MAEAEATYAVLREELSIYQAALADALDRLGENPAKPLAVPEPTDAAPPLVIRDESHAAALLTAGVEIHVFQPTMFHCKMLVVDSQLVSVGSTNFDNRSFRLNDEANLNVYDRVFAERMSAIFEGDLLRSKKMTLAEWQDRPFHERMVEQAASLLSSQL